MKNKRITTKILLFFVYVVVALLLFPLVSSIQENTYNTSLSKTIYVNCNNTDGPWNGTLEHPYRTVQDGVANASINDTVFVFHGTYDDYAGVVLINKSLQLIGENKSTTVIQRKNPEYIIAIVADFVTVRNFTFKHLDPNTISRFMLIESNYNIITDNLFASPGIIRDYGINMYHSHSNIIMRNTFGDNKGFGEGITLTNSSKNYVSDNTFYHCVLISILLLNSTYNSISNNTIQSSAGIGIWLKDDSNVNGILYNKIVSCTYAIYIVNSSYNTISSNMLGGTICAKFLNCVNRWNGNYWERPHILPKLILGSLIIHGIKIPWLNVDWHPSDGYIEPIDKSEVKI